MTALARAWGPPLAWMAVIWTFSTDLGSAEHTARLFTRIASVLAPWATPTQIDLAHHLARKVGHVAEYAILAALWFRALRAGGRAAPSASAWGALAVSVAWAILDELHQATVASRTASVVDVVLDTAGATLALLGIRGRDAVRPSDADRACPAARPRTG